MENKKDAYRTGIENMLNVAGIKVLANIPVNKTLTDMEEVFEACLAKTMKNRRILAQSGVTVTDEF